ncbi:hypothetical protein CQA18_26745, partial [Enterobacter hormaechei]
TGSIGVMMAHSNYGAALEKQGVEITLIYSGSHKVDGNPSAACQRRLPASGHADRPDRLHRRHDGSQ